MPCAIQTWFGAREHSQQRHRYLPQEAERMIVEGICKGTDTICCCRSHPETITQGGRWQDQNIQKHKKCITIQISGLYFFFFRAIMRIYYGNTKC